MNIPKLSRILISLFVTFGALCFSSCNDEDIKESNLSGVWTLSSITEDDVPMTLSPIESSLQMIIEQNGVYRSFAKDDSNTQSHYGSWIITDNTLIDFTLDYYQISTKPNANTEGTWRKNHIPTRFTILSLTNDEMVIRIKTYIANKKYSAMFVEGTRPAITTANIDVLTEEFKRTRTYIYTFKK